MRLLISRKISLLILLALSYGCESFEQRIQKISFECGVEKPEANLSYVKILGSDGSERSRDSLTLAGRHGEFTSRGCLIIPQGSANAWMVAARPFNEGGVVQSQSARPFKLTTIKLARFQYEPIPSPCPEALMTNKNNWPLTFKVADRLLDGYDVTVRLNDQPFESYQLNEHDVLSLDTSKLVDGSYHLKIEVQERFSMKQVVQSFSCTSTIDRVAPSLSLVSSSRMRLQESESISVEPGSALRIESTDALSMENFTYCFLDKYDKSSICTPIHTDAHLIPTPGEGDWILEISASDLGGNVSATHTFDVSVQNADKVQTISILLNNADSHLQSGNALDSAIGVMKAKKVFDTLKAARDKQILQSRMNSAVIQMQSGLMESYTLANTLNMENNYVTSLLDKNGQEVSIFFRQSSKDRTFEWIDSRGSLKHSFDLTPLLTENPDSNIFCGSTSELIFRFGQRLFVFNSEGVSGTLSFDEGLSIMPPEVVLRDCAIVALMNNESGETTLYDRSSQTYHPLGRPFMIDTVDGQIFAKDEEGTIFLVDAVSFVPREIKLPESGEFVSYSKATQVLHVMTNKKSLVAYDANLGVLATHENIVDYAKSANGTKIAILSSSGEISVIDANTSTALRTTWVRPEISRIIMGDNLIIGINSAQSEQFVWDLSQAGGRSIPLGTKILELRVGPTDVIHVMTESNSRAFDLKNLWNPPIDSPQGQLISPTYCGNSDTFYYIERTGHFHEDLVFQESNGRVTRLDLGSLSYAEIGTASTGKTIACLDKTSQILVGQYNGKVSLVNIASKTIEWTLQVPFSRNMIFCRRYDLSQLTLNDAQDRALLLSNSGAVFELEIASQTIHEKTNLSQQYNGSCHDGEKSLVQFTSAIYLPDQTQALVANNRGEAYFIDLNTFTPLPTKKLVISLGSALQLARSADSIFIASPKGLFSLSLNAKPLLRPSDKDPTKIIEIYFPTELSMSNDVVTEKANFLEYASPQYLWISAGNLLHVSAADWQETTTFLVRDPTPLSFANLAGDGQTLLLGSDKKIAIWSMNPDWVEKRFCEWMSTRIATLRLNKSYRDLSICGL